MRPTEPARTRPAVAVPDTGPALVDVVAGAASVALVAALNTGAVATRPLRSALSRLPGLRLRTGIGGVDDVLRSLDERGRLERAVVTDRLSRVGTTLLPELVRAVLARLDVAGLVAENVDVDRIADDIDLDRIVDRLDLIGLARYVVDGIDLPGIVRESTGSMTSEVVRSAREQSMDADRLVERVVDRMLLRRNSARGREPVGGGDDHH